MHETTTPKRLFRDPSGDASADQCKTRNASFNDWCTRNDAEWIYVGKRSKDLYRHPGQAPMKKGCWLANPTGCPKKPWNVDVNSYKWYDPTAGGSPAACLQRQSDTNAYCGKTDTMMVYHQDPGPEPTAAGCYIAMPSGCPIHPGHKDANSYTWFDPTAGGSMEKCKMRKWAHNDLCNKTDAMMVYRGNDGTAADLHILYK
jgi:hypothetical protein